MPPKPRKTLVTTVPCSRIKSKNMKTGTKNKAGHARSLSSGKATGVTSHDAGMKRRCRPPVTKPRAGYTLYSSESDEQLHGEVDKGLSRCASIVKQMLEVRKGTGKPPKGDQRSKLTAPPGVQPRQPVTREIIHPTAVSPRQCNRPPVVIPTADMETQSPPYRGMNEATLAMQQQQPRFNQRLATSTPDPEKMETDALNRDVSSRYFRKPPVSESRGGITQDKLGKSNIKPPTGNHGNLLQQILDNDPGRDATVSLGESPDRYSNGGVQQGASLQPFLFQENTNVIQQTQLQPPSSHQQHLNQNSYISSTMPQNAQSYQSTQMSEFPGPGSSRLPQGPSVSGPIKVVCPPPSATQGTGRPSDVHPGMENILDESLYQQLPSPQALFQSYKGISQKTPDVHYHLRQSEGFYPVVSEEREKSEFSPFVSHHDDRAIHQREASLSSGPPLKPVPDSLAGKFTHVPPNHISQSGSHDPPRALSSSAAAAAKTFQSHPLVERQPIRTNQETRNDEKYFNDDRNVRECWTSSGMLPPKGMGDEPVRDSSSQYSVSTAQSGQGQKFSPNPNQLPVNSRNLTSSFENRDGGTENQTYVLRATSGSTSQVYGGVGSGGNQDLATRGQGEEANSNYGAPSAPRPQNDSTGATWTPTLYQVPVLLNGEAYGSQSGHVPTHAVNTARNQVVDCASAPRNQMFNGPTLPTNQGFVGADTPRNQAFVSVSAPTNQIYSGTSTPRNQAVDSASAPRNQMFNGPTIPTNQGFVGADTPRSQAFVRSSAPTNKIYSGNSTPRNQTNDSGNTPRNQAFGSAPVPGNQAVDGARVPGNFTVQYPGPVYMQAGNPQETPRTVEASQGMIQPAPSGFQNEALNFDIGAEMGKALQPLIAENSQLRSDLRLVNQQLKDLERQLTNQEAREKELANQQSKDPAVPTPDSESVCKHLEKDLQVLTWTQTKVKTLEKSLEEERCRSSDLETELRQSQRDLDQYKTDRQKLLVVLGEKDTEKLRLRQDSQREVTRLHAEVQLQQKQSESYRLKLDASEKESHILAISLKQRDTEIGRLQEVILTMKKSMSDLIQNEARHHNNSQLASSFNLQRLERLLREGNPEGLENEAMNGCATLSQTVKAPDNDVPFEKEFAQLTMDALAEHNERSSLERAEKANQQIEAYTRDNQIENQNDREEETIIDESDTATTTIHDLSSVSTVKETDEFSSQIPGAAGLLPQKRKVHFNLSRGQNALAQINAEDDASVVSEVPSRYSVTDYFKKYPGSGSSPRKNSPALDSVSAPAKPSASTEQESSSKGSNPVLNDGSDVDGECRIVSKPLNFRQNPPPLRDPFRSPEEDANSVTSGVTFSSVSTLATVDESVFREGLANLDANIARLQESLSQKKALLST